MKIVFLDEGTLYGVENISKLKKLGEYVSYHATQPNETLSRVIDAEIVITNKVVLDAAILSQCKNLKLICVAATGTNNIDIHFAKENHIEVKNVSGYSTHSVAQITFTLIFQLLTNPSEYDQFVKNGNYAKHDFFTHIITPFGQLEGKKIGILGLGSIGKQVANIAEAFGMQVQYTSLSGNEREEKYPKTDLDNLLKTSDIVSIHTPLTEKTKNIITYQKLKLLQKHAILINVARGGIVNEFDLAQALNEDVFAGAGIDVFEKEPIDPKNPLLDIKNKQKIVLFPHIAWASVEARTMLVEKLVTNIINFLANKN
ncbi:MAG: D-2-hydroxyacid dehydrogenase [Bacteroidetes bacterium]|nr:MAG: D-2-hydroxyacid dehydrogenase [Bacteroidota bacterium]